MDVGTVLSVAQTLFAALQCSDLREFFSVLGYQSELDKLEMTVNTVKAVLQDAEAKEELPNHAQVYIDRLKDAVYDADDLLDEFVTMAERKKNQLKEGGKISNKVHTFFSKIKDLGVAYSMSHGVKEIRGKLDSIADNHNKFGFRLDSEPIRKRREETCSYVYAHDIIGREGDREKIVGMLLDSSTVQRDVSFLTIVGMGGLGKTTLAQLVYNDENIKEKFPSRFWVCLSDEDPKHLNVKAVFAKILASTTGLNHDECTMDWLQGQVREQLARKRYLLILDDVWNEDHNQWLELEKFLRGGQSGNWVVVTTRSRNTASIVGDGSLYDLKGLSDEDSRHLFERTAFGQEESQANPPELVEIGRDIVKRCANVPLAIRVAGSLLYGQGKDKWLSFQEKGLAGVRRDENGILSILKLSYHHLESQLKNCFSYCALFPKDTVMKKEKLISLWMAQGYIVAFDEDQSMDDAGDEYFSILLRRCFFQDVEEDKYGEIISCKIHDLMHDVALEVARKEVRAVNVVTNDFNLDKIRHISVVKSMGVGGSWTKNKVRTLLLPLLHDWCRPELPVDTLLGNWRCLRALDLSNQDIETLPDTIGKLLHLRYLDLSYNPKLKALPKSIIKLHNLQTLDLCGCYRLKELPSAFSKLVKLRCLNTVDCVELTNMPWGMCKLSCLHTLKMFVVDLSNSSCVDQLEGLKALTKLKGRIEIKIHNSKDAKYVRGSNCEGGYLINKPRVNKIKFIFKGRMSDESEALMEDMQPHCNLKRLQIQNYDGVRMPMWARDDNLASSLPNLVRIDFRGCRGLQCLPHLGKLRHLRFLQLEQLSELEYTEENSSSSSSSSNNAGDWASATDEFSFFPSLQVLRLIGLNKLKGWRRGVEDVSLLPSFPHLSELLIRYCPELTCIPPCPNLEVLQLLDFNGRLRLRVTETDNERGPTFCYSSSKLRKMKIDNLKFLKTWMPLEAFRCITEMRISYDKKRESLEEAEEVFQSFSSFLRSLSIEECSELRSVSGGGLEHLTALEELDISNCPNLALTMSKDGMPWRALHQSLRSLKLLDLPKLVNLPEGMQHLTSLQSLTISECKALESMPEWMTKLTSLTQLDVRRCSEGLMQRCQSPFGADWPYIQHISQFTIYKEWYPETEFGGYVYPSMGDLV